MRKPALPSNKQARAQSVLMEGGPLPMKGFSQDLPGVVEFMIHHLLCNLVFIYLMGVSALAVLPRNILLEAWDTNLNKLIGWKSRGYAPPFPLPAHYKNEARVCREQLGLSTEVSFLRSEPPADPRSSFLACMYQLPNRIECSETSGWPLRQQDAGRGRSFL